MEQNQDLSYGRMSRAPSRPTKGRTSKQSSKPSSVLRNRPPRCLRLTKKAGPMQITIWETDGASHIEFLTLNGGAYPSKSQAGRYNKTNV